MAKPLSSRTALAYGALLLLFAIVATYRVLDFTERVGDLVHGDVHAREPFDLDLPEFRLVSVEAEAAEAGLKPNDVVQRINGVPVRHTGADLWLPLRAASAGDRMTVEVMRPDAPNGSHVTASIVLRPIRTGPVPLLELAGFAVVNVAMPLVCTVLGFWVAAVRVRDRRAWLLLLLVLSLPEFGGGYFRFLAGRDDWFQPIAAAYQPLLANMWPTAMLLFAISFPERLGFDRRMPWLKWVVVAPVILRIVALNPVFDFVARRDPEAAMGFRAQLAWTGLYFGPSYPLFLLLFLAIMAYRAFTERQPDARRRLMLLLSGAALSVTPLFIFVVLLAAGYSDFPAWSPFPLLAALLLLPLSMAYVIVVHRAMDVRVVIRQGLRYLLARGSLRALQFVVSSATLAGAITLGGRSVNLVAQVAFIAGGVGAIVLIRRFSETLRQRVDRRFFREAYDAEQILTALSEDVRTIVDTDTLLTTVGQRVATSLHVQHLAVLVRQNGAYAPAYRLGELPAVRLAADSLVAARLRESRQPLRVGLEDPASWVSREAGPDDRAALSALESELLLPLAVKDTLLGILSLGPKRSEEP